MSYTLSPYTFPQALTDDGDPLNGGLLYTYAAGTTTPATTYRTSAGTANTNPIVLSSAGRYVIFIDSLSYKFVLTDSLGNPIATQDNIASTVIGVGSGLGEVFSFGSNSASPITATTYASGATFDTLHPGSAVYAVDSANLVGTYALQVTGLQLTSGTLTVAIVNLTDGAPDTPLATATITSATGEVATSGTITFPAAGAVKQFGLKPKVSANTGFLIGAALVRTA